MLFGNNLPESRILSEHYSCAFFDRLNPSVTMIRRSWMTGISIETTLELWASWLRAIKARMAAMSMQEFQRLGLAALSYHADCAQWASRTGLLDQPRPGRIACRTVELIEPAWLPDNGTQYQKRITTCPTCRMACRCRHLHFITCTGYFASTYRRATEA